MPWAMTAPLRWAVAAQPPQPRTSTQASVEPASIWGPRRKLPLRSSFCASLLARASSPGSKFCMFTGGAPSVAASEIVEFMGAQDLDREVALAVLLEIDVDEGVVVVA